MLPLLATARRAVDEAPATETETELPGDALPDASRVTPEERRRTDAAEPSESTGKALVTSEGEPEGLSYDEVGESVADALRTPFDGPGCRNSPFAAGGEGEGVRLRCTGERRP